MIAFMQTLQMCLGIFTGLKIFSFSHLLCLLLLLIDFCPFFVSNRKPKVNSQLVAQQTAQQVLPTPPKIQKMAVPRKNTASNKRRYEKYVIVL